MSTTEFKKPTILDTSNFNLQWDDTKENAVLLNNNHRVCISTDATPCLFGYIVTRDKWTLLTIEDDNQVFLTAYKELYRKLCELCPDGDIVNFVRMDNGKYKITIKVPINASKNVTIDIITIYMRIGKKIPIGQFLENAFDWLLYTIVCRRNSSKLTGS
ncbi:hypothetical protein WA158_000658 [Blastocystis sp. Blastoise]